jgi:hypothetical protein
MRRHILNAYDDLVRATPARFLPQSLSGAIPRETRRAPFHRDFSSF